MKKGILIPDLNKISAKGLEYKVFVGWMDGWMDDFLSRVARGMGYLSTLVLYYASLLAYSAK